MSAELPITGEYDLEERPPLNLELVGEYFEILGSGNSDEEDRIRASERLGDICADWHASNLPRGTETRACSPGMSQECLSRLYEFIIGHSGVSRIHLLRAAAHVGDQKFLFPAEYVCRQADELEFCLCVRALGNIGGPHSVRWLREQFSIQSKSRQASIQLAIRAIKHGSVSDFAEGLTGSLNLPAPYVAKNIAHGILRLRLEQIAVLGGAVDKLGTTKYALFQDRLKK